jgi:pilus assembly protein Flp/PilA
MSRFVVSFVNDECGATSIEYGVVALLISLTILIAVTQIGISVKGFFDPLGPAV